MPQGFALDLGVVRECGTRGLGQSEVHRVVSSEASDVTGFDPTALKTGHCSRDLSAGELLVIVEFDLGIEVRVFRQGNQKINRVGSETNDVILAFFF